MYTYATYQPIIDNQKGVIRVYTDAALTYKFYITVLIKGDIAEIEGELNQDIGFKEFKAIGRVLLMFGIAKLSWQYKGRECFIKFSKLDQVDL